MWGGLFNPRRIGNPPARMSTQPFTSSENVVYPCGGLPLGGLPEKWADFAQRNAAYFGR
jgi:hypothetical protein